MWYYIAFFSILSLLLFSMKRSKRIVWLPMGAIFLLLFVFSAIRYGLGRDFNIYHYAYLVPGSWAEINFEPIWVGFNSLLRWLHLDFSVWLTITSLAFVSLVYKGIREMSDDFVLSVICMVCIYSVYFESMNLVRQHIAMAVCFAATPWLLRRKWVHFGLAVVLASFLHKSALFALVILPVGLLPWSTAGLLIVTIGGIVMGNLFVRLITNVGAIGHLAGDYFFYIKEAYAPESDTGFYKLFLTTVACLLIYIRSKLRKEDRERLSFFFVMVIVSIAIYNATIGFEVAMRLMYYPFVYLIILLPNTIVLRGNDSKRAIMIWAIIALFFIFTIKTISDPKEPYYYYRTVFAPKRY